MHYQCTTITIQMHYHYNTNALPIQYQYNTNNIRWRRRVSETDYKLLDRPPVLVVGPEQLMGAANNEHLHLGQHSNLYWNE